MCDYFLLVLALISSILNGILHSDKCLNYNGSVKKKQNMTTVVLRNVMLFYPFVFILSSTMYCIWLKVSIIKKSIHNLIVTAVDLSFGTWRHRAVSEWCWESCSQWDCSGVPMWGRGTEGLTSLSQQAICCINLVYDVSVSPHNLPLWTLENIPQKFLKKS